MLSLTVTVYGPYTVRTPGPPGQLRRCITGLDSTDVVPRGSMYRLHPWITVVGRRMLAGRVPAYLVGYSIISHTLRTVCLCALLAAVVIVFV